MGDFGPEQRAECVEHIRQGATPGPAYYILIVLSSLIAAYGLLSNSTATVIGAMLVAPLMGPILGLAMGTVLGEARMFRHSLIAELSGVVLVIATGAAVAQFVGVDHIDFAASEIAGRIRPTLYDMAIGLAAGLAGSFCLIHPGLRSSVAGVAIAVALVPPLTVTGITTAGWLHGLVPWRSAFGSFMLFLANFLTIELAAGVLFYVAGFRALRPEEGGGFRRSIVLQLLLLLSTAAFLSGQLANLVRERIGMTLSRQALQTALAEIPGAGLDDLEVQLRPGALEVRAVVGSRAEITPAQVATMQKGISEALGRRYPGLEVGLVVRTISSTYASPTGFLFEPQGAPPSPEQARSQQLERALRSVLAEYPGVELNGFRPVSSPTAADPSDQRSGVEKTWLVEVTLSSPYDFHGRLVAELEKRLGESLASSELFAGAPIKLMVRTVPVSTANAFGTVSISAPGADVPAENQDLDRILTDALQPLGQQVVLLNSRPVRTGASGRAHYVARVRVRGPSLLDETQARRLRDEVQQTYRQQTGQSLDLDLEIDSELARQISIAAEVEGSPTPTPTPVVSASPLLDGAE